MLLKQNLVKRKWSEAEFLHDLPNADPNFRFLCSKNRQGALDFEQPTILW